jgi:hypothetical protein
LHAAVIEVDLTRIVGGMGSALPPDWAPHHEHFNRKFTSRKGSGP